MAPATSQQTGTTATTQEREFVQRRLATFGLVTAALALLYLVTKVAVALAISRQPEVLLRPTLVFHAVAVVGFASIWLGCRGAVVRSKAYLEVVEIGGLSLGCSGFALLAYYFPMLGTSAYMLTLILTYVFIIRAALVPSTPFKTAGLTLSAGAPLVAFDYFQLIDRAPLVDFLIASRPEGKAFAAEYFAADAAGLAVMESMYTGLWWLLTSSLAIITSHVIYGLRREVKAARKLGQYTLKEKLGEGGMGVVYRAEHALLCRPTALKLLLPSRAGETHVLRFEREVMLTSKLSHPNTVTVFDFGRTADGIFYYAMELLEGCTLERLVEIEGPQPAGRVVHVLKQVIGALIEAHGIGLIHRDIKPANIILCERGGMFDVAKVVDFGLVKPMHEAPDAAVTHGNLVAGTPLYMSPESITASGSIDGRSDLYSLGAVAYFLVTGEHVFSGHNAVEVCSHHLHTTPIPPSQRTKRPIPVGLEAIILSCLAKSADDRPKSAVELAARLAQVTDFSPWTPEDASAWWTANGARARAHPVPPGTTVPHHTIAVDPNRGN